MDAGAARGHPPQRPARARTCRRTVQPRRRRELCRGPPAHPSRSLAGDHPAAAAAEQALQLYPQLGSRLGQANALDTLALVRHAIGDYTAALTIFEQAIDLFRDAEDPDGEAEPLNHIGESLLAPAAPSAARQRFTAALGIARAIGTPAHEAHALEGTGACAFRDDRHGEGIARLRRALATYRRIGSPHTTRTEAALHHR
ncbi:MAG: tetratricopeptide repeat protein [Dactylosporangium sp.]|nr:tetratricopeptide repeat protein [Dactylosporangium sp.]NNJ60204.1 tetratricopeptide repeat protein [Dactylosporangium sp.]